MSTLQHAIEIAVAAHKGQTDKAGAPYILHPLRLMLAMATDEERIVAILHDVPEDCPDWTFARLRAEGFSERVLSALDGVTKRGDENYNDFIKRAARDPISRNVKLADLRDNSDLSRIDSPTAQDFERARKYRRAIQLIG